MSRTKMSKGTGGKAAKVKPKKARQAAASASAPTTQGKGRRKRSAITPELKAQVKAAVEAGKTGAEIAKELDIWLTVVQSIKKELGLIKGRTPPTRYLKIRFMDDWPNVADKVGRFSVGGVNRGPHGMTLSEMITSGSFDSPSMSIVICATHMDGHRGLVGTRLCNVDFASCDAAADAMRNGIEVIPDVLVQAFVDRLIKAKKVELVE